MADLDYAFLADYTSVSEGKLTAVGASFTQAFVMGSPSALTFGIAGRVRGRMDEEAPELAITIGGIAGFEVTTSTVLVPGPDARPYADGKVGLLFSLMTTLPVEADGLVTVDLALDGRHVRRLAFDVNVISMSHE